MTGAEPWFVRAENLLLLTVASFTRTWEAAATAHLELYRTQLPVHQERSAEVAGWALSGDFGFRAL